MSAPRLQNSEGNQTWRRDVHFFLQEHPDELGSDPFVGYVSQMLVYLAQRIDPGTDCPPPALLPLEKPRNGGGRKAGGSRGSDELASGIMMGGGHGRGAVQDASVPDSMEGGLEAVQK